MRLLKLVNTLLDFSRIEAGRVQATYSATDLAATDRRACQHLPLGLREGRSRLIVDCPALPAAGLRRSRHVGEDRPQPALERLQVHVRGRASRVALRAIGGTACSTVSDTGIGIPAEELPRLFERFHRIEGAHGRTHEGTGIGLALVQELVKLHGGTIAVESTVGAGHDLYRRFRRHAHLPADQSRVPASLQTARATDAFVEEALRWLPDPSASAAVLSMPASPADDRPLRADVRRAHPARGRQRRHARVRAAACSPFYGSKRSRTVAEAGRGHRATPDLILAMS